MFSPRNVLNLVAGAWAFCAITYGAAAAQSGDKHSLRAVHLPGQLNRVEVQVQVGGDLKLVGDDSKSRVLPMSVVANLRYDEAPLAQNAQGHRTRTARYYDDARAVIKIEDGGDKPAIDPSRRLIVAESTEKNPSLLYCPTARLKREELDLIDVPGSTLAIDAMLPADPVALGESWKIKDTTLAGLLCLDAVSWCDVQAVMGEFVDGVADIAAAGNVSGAVGGVATEIELKAKYKFDSRTNQVTQFAVLIKEKRSIGHVGPGLDTVAKVILKITPVTGPSSLTSKLLAQVPAKTSPELLELAYTPRGGQFRFDYDRRWYVTGDDPKLAVLRLVDRGELVAQCNVSALPAVKKPVPLAEFQRDVERTLGKNFGKFTSAGQAKNDAGQMVFRVVVEGTVSDLPIEWIYYLIQDEQGRRVSLAFTLEQELRQRFAASDRTVVQAIQITEPAVPTAAKPPVTKSK